MAMVNFKKGLLANLPAAKVEGTFYVTTDERAIYLDVDGSTRIRLGDFIEVANIDALPTAGANVNALYYVTDINCPAKWNGTEWIQINRDTGAPSIDVVGDGNAVTAASYDPVTRKVTLTMGETFVKTSEVGSLAAKNEVAEDDLEANLKAKVNAAEGNHAHANKDELGLIEVGDKAKWDAAEKNAKDYADGLAQNYDAAGAAKAVQGETTGTVKSVEDDLSGYKTSNDKAVADAQKSADDAMAEAEKRVASVAAGDESVTVAGTATAPTVAAKLSKDADNALKLASDGLKVVIPAAAEYSLAKDETSADYAAVYHLTKDGVNVGAAINIPKDMVVESGSVVELADGEVEGYAAGTYIKLVLANADGDVLYINVNGLIEYVTSGSAAGDMVVIVVSDDHKVTASITDGSITLAKLAADVQTAIGKAHTHDNKDVLDGIDANKVANWDDAFSKEHEHANKAELDKFATSDKAALDSAVAAQHTHANADELDLIETGDKEKWDASEQNAKDYADGLMAWGSF